MNKWLILLLALTFSTYSQNKQVESILNCEFIQGLTPSDKYHCGQISVPENHDDPNGKKIQISYIVLHAKDISSKAYPMVFLSGGPGGNLISSAQISNFLTNPIREKRDVILVDQRGIGYSSALPNLYEEIYDIMAKNATDAEELDLYNILIKNYSDRCKDQNIHLEYYNTFQNAKDIGLLMKHLNRDKFNIYGGSYGTRLARVVQELYPEYLNAVILNSPNPIKGDFLVDRLKSYALALERMLDYCKNDSVCNSKYPLLKTDYLLALNRLKKNALELNIKGKPFYLNSHDGVYFLRRQLYRNNAKTMIPLLIKEYLDGGGPIINNLVKNEFGPGYNFAMWLAVERYEMFNEYNNAEVIDEVYDKLELLPVKLGLFSPVYLAMKKLHNSTLSENQKNFQISAVPTIITVNHFDPVTPPENGHILMKKLSKGKLFILDEAGHGGGNFECRTKIIIAFMDNPSGTLDTSCFNVYRE